MDCVIGSGPAGVACTAALLARGRRVHMVDGGMRLEPERSEIVQKLGDLVPESWSREHIQWLTGSRAKDAKGSPLKLKFGSNYPYRGTEHHLHLSSGEMGLKPSLAFGGLSTVWGAAMLPYTPDDIVDWPLNIEELYPHYEEVLKLTGLAADRDDLADHLPLFTESPGYLNMSRQASSMWSAMVRNRDELRDAGISFGRARLAIKAKRLQQDRGCVYCGMCMYGCPYGHIYSSEHTVLRFQLDQRFSYRPDVVVTSVQETQDHVTVHGYDRLNCQPIAITAERVYLAAGAISTTGVLLRSMAAYDRRIMMKDSQYFLLPLVLTTRIANVRDERLHALSQIFLEITDRTIGPYTIHLQIYSFNNLIAREIRMSMGPLASTFEFLAREIEGRMIILLGYLHSAQSSTIAVTLRGGPGKEQLYLEPVVNADTKRIVHGVVRKLFKHSFKLGAVPLSPLLKVTEPGRGFHVGGTFPMRETPGEFETDVWGRPRDWKRLHIVDASVLPSISATTITFTAMANAHRIASHIGASK